MQFYVNSFDGPEKGSEYQVYLFGLFDANNWSGEGHGMGDYGAEYYNNTNLLAYFGVRGGLVDATLPRVKGLTCSNEHYDKVLIQSRYTEYTFQANTLSEAIDIFDKGLYL